VDAARPSAVLHLDGVEEAAAREDPGARVGQAVLAHRPQALEALVRPGGLDDLLDEHLASALDRGHLQFLLGAEVREHSALGDLQLGGQAPDRQALEPLDRGDLGRALEDRAPRLLAAQQPSVRGRHRCPA
jgi:hypothetical protein